MQQRHDSTLQQSCNTLQQRFNSCMMLQQRCNSCLTADENAPGGSQMQTGTKISNTLQQSCNSCMTACVRIRPHTSAYVSIRQHTSAYIGIRKHTSAYVSTTSAYVGVCASRCTWTHRHPHKCLSTHSIRQHTSAYVSIRGLTVTHTCV